MKRVGTRQEGYALVTAIVMLGIMLMVGLTVVSLGDTQAKRSGEQRIRESSLNLAEGVLYGQGFVLAHNWPGSAGNAYPPTCTEAAAAGLQCPNRDTLAAANSSTKAAAAFDATLTRHRGRPSEPADPLIGRSPAPRRGDGIYSYTTSQGRRWRFVVRQGDGSISSRRGFTIRSAAATACSMPCVRTSSSWRSRPNHPRRCLRPSAGLA